MKIYAPRNSCRKAFVLGFKKTGQSSTEVDFSMTFPFKTASSGSSSTIIITNLIW